MEGIDKTNNTIEIAKTLGLTFEQYHFLMGLTGLFLGVLLIALVFGVLVNLKV